MILFWTAILAISTLLYVVLDGFDLGVGILSLGARSEARRNAMINAIAPIWDGNETWLVVTGVVLRAPSRWSTQRCCRRSIHRCSSCWRG